ncbi:MAG: polysaccharide deacetylase family protein [Clostridiales bacterium]|nr:polysaccharide deacetylase family protein [Clostridiales bacterium]
MKSWKQRLAAGLLTAVLCVSLAPGAFAASAYDCPGQKLAALTFDDGPCRNSEAILNILKAHGAKATFFLNGTNLDLYAPQVRRMAAEGHQVANHTYHHPDLVQCSPAQVKEEVGSLARSLTAITGLQGTGGTGFYLRPPFGSRNPEVLAQVGVPVVCWTVDSSDWNYKSADHLVNFVTANTRDGDIILVHETVPTTVQGLPRLLTQLQAKGFELVTVEELFWRRGITPQAGGLYRFARNTGVNRCARALYFDERRLDTHWAYGAITYVRSKGLMEGNEYGEFTPNFPMTRGMFVTMLGRLSGVQGGSQTASGFADIPTGHYAAPYAAWAKASGVMLGIDEANFGANLPLTRQQMAVALARYAKLRKALIGPFDLSAYADQAAIAPWAREGVAACSALGFLNGADGAFCPDGITTRAMGATILQRLDQFSFPTWNEHPKIQKDLWSISP